MSLTIKRCLKCGATVEVLHDCTCENCGVKCCGEEMRVQLPNTVDASVEKHLPVVEVNGNEVVVYVPHVWKMCIILNGLHLKQKIHFVKNS